MPIESVAEMIEKGWEDKGDGTCKDKGDRKGCGAPVRWWRTNNGKWFMANEGTHTAHWDTCPNQNDSSGKKQSTGHNGEPLSILRVNSGNCRIDGEPAVVRWQILEAWGLLCGRHANQLYLKLKHSGKQEAPVSNDPGGATGPAPDQSQPPPLEKPLTVPGANEDGTCATCDGKGGDCKVCAGTGQGPPF